MRKVIPVGESRLTLEEVWIPSDLVVGHEILGILRKDFPGYAWDVLPRTRDHVCDIALTDVNFSGNRRPGYHINLRKDFYDDPTRKIVRKAGGEFIDRYRLSVKANQDQIAGLKEFAGQTVGDFSSMKNGYKQNWTMELGWDLYK